MSAHFYDTQRSRDLASVAAYHVKGTKVSYKWLQQASLQTHQKHRKLRNTSEVQSPHLLTTDALQGAAVPLLNVCLDYYGSAQSRRWTARSVLPPKPPIHTELTAKPETWKVEDGGGQQIISYSPWAPHKHTKLPFPQRTSHTHTHTHTEIYSVSAFYRRHSGGQEPGMSSHYESAEFPQTSRL